MAASRFPTSDEMATRVTRFEALREDWDLFLDNFLPGHERANLMMVGPNTGWDDAALRAPVPSEDFSLGIQKVPPGNGPGLHSHRTVEVFVILSGNWIFYWNDESGDFELPLGQWDGISVPPGVWRGLRNVGDETAYLLGIVGGTDGGGVMWHPSIVDAARAQGRELDETGRLRR